MAAWWNELSTKCKIACIVATGASVTGLAYLSYRVFNRASECEEENDDDSTILDTPAPERKILVLGINGSGKSSILAYLGKQEVEEPPVPTEGFNVMCVQTEKASLNIWEIGGSKHMRKYWGNFTQDTYALVYVVDSSDEDGLATSAEALQELLKDDKLKTVPVVVVANKQDSKDAKTEEEIILTLNINDCLLSHLYCTVLTQAPVGGDVAGIHNLEDVLTTMTS